MRNLFLVLLLCIVVSAEAQLTQTMYVAAKTGLSLREKPDVNAKLIEKIPYGAKVSYVNADDEWIEISTEGMNGYWRKVKYNNKTGFVVDAYLFSVPPPKLATVKELKQYLTQLSAPFGAKLIIKSGSSSEITEGGWELHKQLYKNGAEWHEGFGYEYGSDTYFLPQFSLQQGFLLLRLIPEFSQVFEEKDEFPRESKKITKGDKEYDIKIKKVSEDALWIDEITVSFEDGAYYELKMYQIDFQLVIVYSSGV